VDAPDPIDGGRPRPRDRKPEAHAAPGGEGRLQVDGLRDGLERGIGLVGGQRTGLVGGVGDDVGNTC
jgi:hypothetical protein